MAERGRPRGFDRDKALRRAMELFWRHGYEGVSMADLTAAMGIAAPSLYAAFSSKEALFRAVIVVLTERITAELTEVVSGCTDPVDAVRTAALAWIDLAGDPVI